MRALIQRVSESSVEVSGKSVAAISKGFLILLGVAEEDTDSDLDQLAKKIPALRIFPDAEGKMNLSVADIKGDLLVVSQFTLIADTAKGNRPSFFRAAKPEKANFLYEKFIEKMRATGLKVETGIFGADMKLRLLNDGPVTILLDTRERE
jgi:D-tyrosyl-tRNA(Tyr) deacylase